MLSKIINTYGLFALILIFIAINIYYKNIINIIIFVITLLALRTYFDDTNAIIGAYAISILYGISKNFHLLENFEQVKSNDKPITKNNIVKILNNLTDVNDDNQITLGDLKNMISNNNIKSILNDSSNIIKQTSATIDSINNLKNKLNPTNSNDLSRPTRATRETRATHETRPSRETHPTRIKRTMPIELQENTLTNHVPEIDSIISEELINQFINRLKKDDNLLITNTKVNIYDLKPTIANISNSKIKKMVKMANDKNPILSRPIVISKDNFIIDGHHRWYTRKYLVENNTNSYNNDFYNEDIKVIIIDYYIKKLIEKLQEYKIHFNREYLSQALLNIKTTNTGRNFMNQLRNNNEYENGNGNRNGNRNGNGNGNGNGNDNDNDNTKKIKKKNNVNIKKSKNDANQERNKNIQQIIKQNKKRKKINKRKNKD